jgi:X-Pro dipeptidyl-peptidase
MIKIHSFKLRPIVFVLAFFTANLVLGQNKDHKAQQNKTLPVFKDGLAQVVEEFSDPSQWIRHDLWVETEFDSDRDGLLDRMHVSVTRPKQTETQGLKLPVIYVTSPYFAGVAGDVPGSFWDVHQELGQPSPPHIHPEVTRRGERPIISNSHIKTWVPRGFIVVHSSSPGTGLSQGAPTVGGINESLAPKAVIDWLCGRAPGFDAPTGGASVKAYWSTKKVGMTGTSYNGTLPLAAATTGVEGLEVIIPIAPNTSYYHYYRSNGLVRSPGGYLGEDIDVLYDFIHSGDPEKRAGNNARVRDSIMALGMDRKTGDYNDFWASRDYLNQMQPMKAALLMAHGFNDWNVMPEHSYRIYDKARQMGLDHQIYYHQNGHGGEPPLWMMNQWFSHYLHGVDNGAGTGPKSWIVREQDPRDMPTAYPDYPHPKAENVTLYPHSGGNTTGALDTESSSLRGQEILIDDYHFSAADLVQSRSSDHRLLYTTAPLKEPIHISGIPKISLKLASSKPAVNLSVYLVALPWNSNPKAPITENIITRGWADPQNTSLRESSPLTPGEFVEVTFDLMPDDQIIPKGAQLGLMIFSSDSEFTLRPVPGTEMTLDLMNTILTIPVVGGLQALKAALE